MNLKRTLTLFFALMFGMAIINTTVSADTIQGAADDTPGVYIFTAGADESAPGACDGLPTSEATADIVQDAIDFDILEYVGDEPVEVLEFTTGTDIETPVVGQIDTTQVEIVTGLTAIDDFGDISNGDDDDANFDTGTTGMFYGGLRDPFFVITADGVIADGVIGSPVADPTSAAEADDNLGGMEIFIFEDAELSGFQLELYGPLNSWIVNFDDFQVNPGTVNAADDILIGIDLDSLPEWDNTYIVDLRLIDDGVVQDAVDSCDDIGAADQSLEIDAIATRKSVLVLLGSLSGNVSEDINNDDIGDVNLEGVVLELLDGDGNPILDGNGNPVTTTTDANGNYVFSSLVPGDYIVVEQQPAGLIDVLEVDGGDDGDHPDNGIVNSIPATVDNGEFDTGNDFVEEAGGSLSGNVSEDTTPDGISSADAPLPGWTLALFDDSGNPVLDANGNPLTTTTDPAGNYIFDNLAPGNYVVVETQEDGFSDVTEFDGGDDGDYPDNGIINNIPATVDLGEDDTGNDFIETRLQFTAVSLSGQNTSSPTLVGWVVLLTASITICSLAVGRKLRSDNA